MIDLKDRKIVLIGGAGFIGHNLALQLKERGANVEVIDGLEVNNLLTFTSVDCTQQNRELYVKMINMRLEMLREAGIPLHVQDARDYHLLNKVLNKIQPQVVVQLAAVSHAGKSNKDPHSTFDHSLRTLENALDYSSKAECVEHFIYFSSSMIYGHFPPEGVTEETPCNPIGIYGALKLAGEKMVQAYNQVFEMPYTIIRPSALYGERCVSRRVGQIFIENAVLGKEVMITGDGSDCLDFTYIDDLTSGIINCIENENARNETFNLTYGESRSLADMSKILLDHFPDLDIKYTPKDHLTPDRGTLSVDKARKMIGYNPQCPLEKGFVKYIEWYKENFSS
jgi:nucleoside-diphosphate-sugar epimerase